MIWFVEREGVRLPIEIRPAAERAGFELAWSTPDGQTHIEHSEDVDALTRRRLEVEEELLREGWRRVGTITPPKPFL